MTPFLKPTQDAWDGGEPWPAHWIVCPEVDPPFMAAYRLTFSLEHARQVRVFVSGDGRYELCVDGLPVGQGPELRDGESGLCRSPEGWNLVDWVHDWPNGVPSGGRPARPARWSTGRW